MGRHAYEPSASAQPPGSSGAALLLEAADAMGIEFPTIGSPRWQEFETRVCAELLEACDEHGGWTIAGALCVALDLDSDSQNANYLAIIDRAAAFLHDEGVSAADIPPFVLDRWHESHTSWNSNRQQDTAPTQAPGPGQTPPVTVATAAADSAAASEASLSRDIDPEPSLPSLETGEERVIRVVHRPDGNRNEICVAHRRDERDDEAMAGAAGRPINFIAFIRSTDSDPNRAPRAWYGGPTLRSVYILVAEGAVNAPPPRGFTTWDAPHLAWFIARVC